MHKDPQKIKKMFSKVAGKYDATNSAMSFGIYKSWYKKLIDFAEISEGMKVLDCATGTGNIAFEINKRVGNKGSVTGVDFCEEMLVIARKKSTELQTNITFENADVLNLKYDDNSFDAATIGFGIRNVLSVEKCLLEMSRVVKQGGKVIVLEFGQPKGLFNMIFNTYNKVFLPVWKKFLKLDSDSYSYLKDSSSIFPCREDFISIMNKTECFSECSFAPVSFGIAYIYVGIVK